MRWTSFAVGVVTTTALAAGLWVWTAWPWHYIHGEAPKITDWVQAIGTIVAILLSTVIAVVVPLYVRWLEVRRYRDALKSMIVLILDEMHSVCQYYYSGWVDAGELPAIFPYTSSRLIAYIEQLRSFPLVMTEAPFVHDGFVTFFDAASSFAQTLGKVIPSDARDGTITAHFTYLSELGGFAHRAAQKTIVKLNQPEPDRDYQAFKHDGITRISRAM